jgi:hypothetical protein
MPKKSKTGSYKRAPYDLTRRTYIVHHKEGVIPIEEFGDIKKMMQYIPKRTLHAKGGLIKGKPKLAKRGF